MVTATLAREAVAPARLGGRVWVSYARLSKAKNDGRGGSLAIERQHAENRAYIARTDPGARVIELADDGYSGFLDVYRPDFEQALALVERREVHALVGWHADRLTRQVEVTARVVKACRTSGVELHTALGGFHADPMRIYFEAIMAENESQQKRNRMLSKHREIAEVGGFSGGQRRYGFEPGNVALRESEAAVIRDLANRALTGESLASLARSLNTSGIPTARGVDDDGKPYAWNPSVIRAMLVSPHLAAIREHDGKRYDADWPEVIPVATHEALVRKLTDPSRRKVESTANKYLLSGLAVCGTCGAAMRGTNIGRIDRMVYRCQAPGSCRAISRGMADVDTLVRDHVVALLETLDVNGLLTSDESNRQAAALVAERDELAARRDSLGAVFASGALDAAGLASATAAITAREAEVDAAIAHLADTHAAPVRALEGATGPDAGRVWDAWTEDTTGAGLARQREIVRLLLTVTINPTTRGARRFVPEHVDIQFRPLP